MCVIRKNNKREIQNIAKHFYQFSTFSEINGFKKTLFDAEILFSLYKMDEGNEIISREEFFYNWIKKEISPRKNKLIKISDTEYKIIYRPDFWMSLYLDNK